MSDDEDPAAYTINGIPPGMYEAWKALVSGNERLGDRIIRLMAADLAVSRNQQISRIGLLEVALQDNIITQDDIQAALDTPLPDEDNDEEAEE